MAESARQHLMRRAPALGCAPQISTVAAAHAERIRVAIQNRTICYMQAIQRVSVAQARLVNLARRGGLSGASRAAYADELSAVIRVGPFGDAAGASKLVRVRFLDPVCRGDVMTLALRWEATGVTSALFPVLDADITLTPAGRQATRLALAGSYRAPLGGLGAGLDKAILHRVATATIRALLRNVADGLASPGTTAARQAEPASGPAPWPYIEPEMP